MNPETVVTVMPMPGAHFQQTASLLTCAHVDAAPFSNGISIDQGAGAAAASGNPIPLTAPESLCWWTRKLLAALGPRSLF